MLRLDRGLIRVLYLLFLALWIIGDLEGNQSLSLKAAKYGCMLLAAVLGLFIVAANRARLRPRLDVLWRAAGCAGLFAAYSIAVLPFNGMGLHLGRDLFFLLAPALFAFAVANADAGGKRFYFDGMLIAAAASFLLVNIERLVPHPISFSFWGSYSPLESAHAHTFAVLFVYYRMKGKRGRMLLAALLTLLAFKRLHVLFVLGMLLLGRSAARLRVTKAKLAAAVLFFALSPILLLPGVSSGLIERALPESNGAAIILERLDDFSTGRLGHFAEVSAYPESKLGLGRVNHLLEVHDSGVRPLHSDLLRLLWEIAPLGPALFAVFYFGMLCRSRNPHAFLLMCFLCSVMLLSTCLHSFLGWFAALLLLEDS